MHIPRSAPSLAKCHGKATFLLEQRVRMHMTPHDLGISSQRNREYYRYWDYEIFSDASGPELVKCKLTSVVKA